MSTTSNIIQLRKRSPEDKDAYMFGVIIENVLLKRQVKEANAIVETFKREHLTGGDVGDLIRDLTKCLSQEHTNEG